MTVGGGDWDYGLASQSKQGGLSRTEVADLVASAPFLLRYSLKNRLIPALDFLKRVVLLDKRGVFALMLRPRFFWIHVDKNAIPNVALLRELGVPQSCISLLVSGNPSVVAGNEDKFNLCARKAIEMGFDPSKVTFVDAICVLFGMSKSAWERKVEVYKRWGVSDDDIHWAFKKFPRCMILSEKKITSGMDFLVNEIDFEPITVARTPKTLGYSLDKRIIPRCSVIRVLSLNGLIKKEKGLSAIISTSEERLLDAFVTKYQDQVPQLLNVYQKKTDVLELGIGNEGTPEVKTAIVYQENKISSLDYLKGEYLQLQDVNFAMEASRKSQIAFAAANTIMEEAQHREGFLNGWRTFCYGQVLFDSETVRWLNHAVEKIWPVCMEPIVSRKILLPIIPWFLEKYKPWTVKDAVVQHLYMGRSPPVFTEMRVLHQTTDDDHLVLELGMNFRTADDRSAILAVKLSKRLGFRMRAKLHLMGMHVEGKVINYC
ncbi:C2 domain-containing protein [Camellia lanceoleosa]|uniref:C2 domain-containing protein n=1 Tax=Camellia lanceoleosa TaxID=1840588 RepID=A0ACC0F0C2_9ERIC|nr:C2 domain-containing protein [Camellia lanceoleosa]